MAAATSTQYTWADIQGHSTRSSLWIVFEDKVYDITSFLTDHPGGEEVLLEQLAEAERRPPAPANTAGVKGENRWVIPGSIILAYFLLSNVTCYTMDGLSYLVRNHKKMVVLTNDHKRIILVVKGSSSQIS